MKKVGTFGSIALAVVLFCASAVSASEVEGGGDVYAGVEGRYRTGVVDDSSRAPEAVDKIQVEGDVYVGLESQYLTRGFDASPDADFVVESGVDLYIGNWSIGYWSVYDGETKEMTETDLFIDYSFDLNDMVSVSIGDTFYQMQGLDDAHELIFSLGLNTLLNPSVTAYWDWDVAEEDGLWLVGSVSHDFELLENLSLHLGAEASYNQQSDFMIGNYSGWHHGELQVGLDYAVNDQIALSPFARFSTPLSSKAEDISGIDDEAMGGLMVLLAF